MLCWPRKRPPCTVSRVCPLVGLRGQSGGCPCLARGQRLCSGQVLVPQPSPVFAAGTAQGQGRAGCSLCRHGTRGHTAGGTAGDGPRPSPGLTGTYALPLMVPAAESPWEGTGLQRRTWPFFQAAGTASLPEGLEGRRGQERHSACDHRSADCRPCPPEAVPGPRRPRADVTRKQTLHLGHPRSAVRGRAASRVWRAV